MKTLIVRYEDRVRFLVTNHPEYRFSRLVDQMPVKITLFGVTDLLAKDIKLRFSNLHLWGEWYRINEEFEEFLSRIV